MNHDVSWASETFAVNRSGFLTQSLWKDIRKDSVSWCFEALKHGICSVMRCLNFRSPCQSSSCVAIALMVFWRNLRTPIVQIGTICAFRPPGRCPRPQDVKELCSLLPENWHQNYEVGTLNFEPMLRTKHSAWTWRKALKSFKNKPSQQHGAQSCSRAPTILNFGVLIDGSLEVKLPTIWTDETTNNKQQTINNKQQTTNNKQQTTNNNNNYNYNYNYNNYYYYYDDYYYDYDYDDYDDYYYYYLVLLLLLLLLLLLQI